MRLDNIDTPVVIFGCKIGGLAILRSLGQLGVSLYGIDNERDSPVLRSRYLREKFHLRYDEESPQDCLAFLAGVAEKIGRRALLIPTSDELAVFVAEYAPELRQHFIFPAIDADLARRLISKKAMFAIASEHGVPTPATLFPKTIEEVEEFASKIAFPIMLKGIHGNRLYARTGVKMVLAESLDELRQQYLLLEDPEAPNLMLQEHIPGGDDQVYIFNGYFNADSDCLAAYTGYKIRQAPIHFGCASLGICAWNEDVARTTIRFMKAIGYRGVLDIGYRLDPRDGRYKVLDINPRVGGAFRIFVAKNGMDVVRSLYLDLTGQEQLPAVPREGRRWVYEDFDIISTYCYFKEGSLRLSDWLASFRGVEEGAWFSWRDPLPFFFTFARLARRLLRGTAKKMTSYSSSQKQQNSSWAKYN